jgi:hypothetical protein
MDKNTKDQQEQNNSPDNFEPEAAGDTLEDSLQKYQAQRLVLEKILEKIPAESKKTLIEKNTTKPSILQRMKRKLHFVFLLTMLVAVTQLQAQNNTRGTNSILFSEDFNGWNAGSLTANGWSTITNSSNYIVPEENAIQFFKQVNAEWMLLIMPGLNLANANMLVFDYKRYSSVVGMQIKIGVMTDPQNANTFAMLDIVTVDNADWKTDTVFLSNLGGAQYLAFNGIGPIPYTLFFIDNVKVIKEEVNADWPSFIKNLLVTPEPQGAETAMLSWTNPDSEADGDELTDLDSVVVQANQAHAFTLLNPVIAGNVSVPVNVPSPGFYVFTVTAFNSEGASSPINSDTVWVGLDTPGPVQDLLMTVVNDSISSLSWSPPVAGAHGQYYNGVVGNYMVTRADGTQFLLDGNTLTFSETFITPGTYNYTVVAVNYAGEGTPNASNAGAFNFQGFLLYEDFWVSVPAFEWEENGDGTEKEWYMSWAEYTGGTAPEAFFWPKYWLPFTGIHRMISPVINTEGLTALSLDFLYYVDWTSGTFKFRVETTSDDGITWHTAWEDTITGDVDPCNINVVIKSEDVGSPNFRFAYSFIGYNEDAEVLAIDAIRIYPTVATDLAPLSLILPDYIRPGDVIHPVAEIKNYGSQFNEYTAVLTFSKGQDTVYKSTLSSSLEPGQAENKTFEEWTALEGDFIAQVKVICEGEEKPDNNILSENIGIYNAAGSRTLVVCEEFTGTWCAYCPGAAMGLDDLVENSWPVAVVAFHRSDSYETAASVQRDNFYNIQGYPTVLFDGIDGIIGGSGTQSLYDEYLPYVESRMAIAADASVTFDDLNLVDSTITVNIILNSASPIQKSSLVLHTYITETHIPHSWLGLDYVDFVQRDVFRGASGVNIDLSDKTETIAVTMTRSALWNRENLELVSYIQDTITQEILNGNKITLKSLGINAPDVIMNIYPNPASDFFRITSEKLIENIDMFSSSGQLVASKRFDSRTGFINVSGLPAGLYIVRINSEAGMIQRKVLVK